MRLNINLNCNPQMQRCISHDGCADDDLDCELRCLYEIGDSCYSWCLLDLEQDGKIVIPRPTWPADKEDKNDN